MYRLMIVDDEKTIRESLSCTIPWENMGFHLVACCKDGLEAYACMLDEYPDVILSDIRMPGLSGVDLAREAKKVDPSVEVILLSGYAEFDLARQAIQYGVRDYLLKPVDEEDLARSFEKAKQILDEREKRQELYYHTQTRLRDQALMDAVPYGFSEKLFQRGNWDFGAESCIAMLRVSNLPEELSAQMIKLFVKELDKKKGTLIFSPLVLDDVFTFCFSARNGQAAEELLQIAAAQNQNVPADGKVSASLCRCAAVGDLCRNLLEEIRKSDRACFLDYNGARNSLEYLRHSACEELLEGCSGQEDLDQAKLTAMTDFVRQMHTPENARNFVTQIMLRLFDMQHEDLGHFIEHLYSYKSVEEIADFFAKSCQSFIHTKGEKPSVSGKIIAYVNENLQDENLSLKWIAEHVVFMNVTYVSKLFQKETGQTFSSFITNLRIERAKRLLSKSDAPHVYDVAGLVGLGNNPRYFSQLFKKYTGVTPSEFLETIK